MIAEQLQVEKLEGVTEFFLFLGLYVLLSRSCTSGELQLHRNEIPFCEGNLFHDF